MTQSFRSRIIQALLFSARYWLALKFGFQLPARVAKEIIHTSSLGWGHMTVAVPQRIEFCFQILSDHRRGSLTCVIAAVSYLSTDKLKSEQRPAFNSEMNCFSTASWSRFTSPFRRQLIFESLWSRKPLDEKRSWSWAFVMREAINHFYSIWQSKKQLVCQSRCRGHSWKKNAQWIMQITFATSSFAKILFHYKEWERGAIERLASLKRNSWM